MMISPETYYRNNIEGRSEQEILRKIRELKKEIKILINTLEHPDYNDRFRCHPSERTRLYWTRQYLAMAIQGLEEIGAVYQPTKAECKSAAFDDNIQYIERVEFTIGGYDCGYETTTIRLDEEHLYMDVNHSLIPKPTNFHIEPDYLAYKEEFLDGLRKLNIGEWRKKYTLERFGYSICDGTQWELSFFYSDDRKPVKIYGDNAYPYNFDRLLELLGKEATELPKYERRRYDYLTKYIHYLKNEGYNRWLQSLEEDTACAENECIPFERYSEMLLTFASEIRFSSTIYKDFEPEDSKEILKRNGIYSTAFNIIPEDIDQFDSQCVLVLLAGIAKAAEIYSDQKSILKMIFQNDCVLKYLERLEILGEESCG